MRPTQKFFPKPGSIPPILGYARVSHQKQYDAHNSIPAQEERIKAYVEMRLKDGPESAFAGAQWDRVYAEPSAQSAFSKPFRLRPIGKLLYQQMEPGSHLVVDKVDRIWRDLEDFCLLMRHFREHGIRVHFVSFLGMSVDSESVGGDWLLKNYAMFAEMESLKISDRVRSARARMRANGLHDGTWLADYMHLAGGSKRKRRGGGHKIYLNDWAEGLWQFIKDNPELTAEQVSEHFNTLGYTKHGEITPIKWTRKKVENLRRFFLTWDHAGRPTLGTFKRSELRAKYEQEVGPLNWHSHTAALRKAAANGQNGTGQVRGRDVEQPSLRGGAGSDAPVGEDGGDLQALPLHD
jgi:DNA invertase Pin-like site-specific DNA recombinase